MGDLELTDDEASRINLFLADGDYHPWTPDQVRVETDDLDLMRLQERYPSLSNEQIFVEESARLNRGKAKYFLWIEIGDQTDKQRIRVIDALFELTTVSTSVIPIGGASSVATTTSRLTARTSSGALKKPIVKRYGTPGKSTLKHSGIEFPAEVAEIEISKLQKLHPVPRPGKSAEHIPLMADDMIRSGYDINHAINVFRMPDGTLRVAGGHHRIAAMRSIGETLIPARVTPWNAVPGEQRHWFRATFPQLSWP